MKDPDMLGNPNYTIHTNIRRKIETKEFCAVRNWTPWAIAFIAFMATLNLPISSIAKIVLGLSILIVWPCITAFINYIGEHTGNRYTEKSVPVELRLYDSCAAAQTTLGGSGKKFSCSTLSAEACI